MSKFSQPVQHVVQGAGGYLDAQLDNIKLRTVKGLSKGTGALAGLLLISALVSVFLLALSFALVMWLGEVLESYALAGAIVAGGLFVILLVFILLRKRMFKNSFIGMYEDVLFEQPDQSLNTQEKLDEAILRSEDRVKEQQALVSDRLLQAKEYYTPKRMVNQGLHLLGERRKSGLSGGSILKSLLLLMLRRKKK
ncbi:MAG: phage holin family protein [Bacteroidales bacterium]|nr:phage holin family protein [Bacteroidales bacterium]